MTRKTLHGNPFLCILKSAHKAQARKAEKPENEINFKTICSNLSCMCVQKALEKV